MKRPIAMLAAAMVLSTAASAQNPLLQRRYGTPYEIPPFEKITIDNYREAMLKGLEEEKAEVLAIIANSEAPTFENVIVALDQCGKTLDKARIWSSLNSSNSTEETRALAKELAPKTSELSNFINMNAELFKKVKAVYDNQAAFGLDKEQTTLLEKTYKGFVNGGALLGPDQKKELAAINLKLSELQLRFSQNLMHDTNNTYVIADKLSDLAGLPQSNIDQAAALAEKIGQSGKYAFNMQRPSCNPVLQYCSNRELRKKVYLMYNDRCNHGDEYDNKAIAAEIVSLRLQRSRLMGHDTFADIQLENKMAGNAANVYELLDQIWDPAVERAKDELSDIKAMMKADRVKGEPQRWDYMYYLDKAKKARYAIDESEISEYLEINAVQQGIFYVANKLYGLSFNERTQDYPVYEPTAKSWDVIDRDGNVIAIFYSDFFPRDGKGAGAWCGAFRGQRYDGAARVQPIVTNVCNMTLPSTDKPALQTLDNVETMFHEFGHALHSFFRNVHYSGTSGVERDFVELPSQINEHWAFEPEVLKVYARHYKTGEVIPDELIKKIEASSKYGQGFATVELLAAALVDMDLHTLTEIPENFDVMAFQAQKLAARGIPQQILPRYSVTNFSHSMGGGYSAGYYSYIWSEVLDCDAFAAFKETGDIFNQEVADKFRRYVLTPGGISKGTEMYEQFRGRQPQVEGLLKNRGLDEESRKDNSFPLPKMK
ncbi:MAG: M3 family metallopeptidase [Bacteroidales bacterium]|nr:M3 family metallopeptidase [Candidatus Cryptobacteroides onthequi]